MLLSRSLTRLCENPAGRSNGHSILGHSVQRARRAVPLHFLCEVFTQALTAVMVFALASGLGAAPSSEPLNLNTASVEQLETLPGLGAGRARMVVRVREKNGPFRSVLELRALPRLTEKQFESLRERLYVGPAGQEEQPERVRP